MAIYRISVVEETPVEVGPEGAPVGSFFGHDPGLKVFVPELTLQGVRVMQGADGVPAVYGPAWRHPDIGKWHPGVLLPDELSRAIEDQVLAMMHDGQ